MVYILMDFSAPSENGAPVGVFGSPIEAGFHADLLAIENGSDAHLTYMVIEMEMGTSYPADAVEYLTLSDAVLVGR